MRKFERKLESEPECLRLNSQAWGKEYADNKQSDNATKFYWHVIGGKPVNQIILPNLIELTENHCSFCDLHDISPPSIDTVEHFKPKADFPLNAYEWRNLYYCCCFCQQKGKPFDSKVIRPDEADYEFYRYFSCSYTEGTIMPNPAATAQDQERADYTIKYFRLNEGHPSKRKYEHFKRSRMMDRPFDEFSYRDYIVS